MSGKYLEAEGSRGRLLSTPVRKNGAVFLPAI
ncbi:MAG: hypothetical protein CHACPFDD_03974 [Phycisphaerae bacterium]|nr:hypothetical protein [Phycisphaerae bacterium]